LNQLLVFYVLRRIAIDGHVNPMKCNIFDHTILTFRASFLWTKLPRASLLFANTKLTKYLA